MNELKLTRNELNVLIYALNSMNYQEEYNFKKQGVSVPEVYDKIYTLWEQTQKKQTVLKLAQHPSNPLLDAL
jgi:hypothetical protein